MPVGLVGVFRQSFGAMGGLIFIPFRSSKESNPQPESVGRAYTVMADERPEYVGAFKRKIRVN